MSTIKLPAASGGGSISIKGPASSGSDVDLLDTSGNFKPSGQMYLNDDKKLIVGTGGDMEIYHLSDQNYIYSGNGRINLRASEVRCENAAGSEVLAKFIADGACELRHNDSAKLTTTSSGVSVTGNVAVSSGNGIDFSAHSHATGMSNELLADYERGNWTPGIELGGGTTGVTYTFQNGRYTRIGTYVYASFVLDVNAKGSDTGSLYITGLPFTALNDSGDRIHGMITYYGSVSSIRGSMHCYGGTNATKFNVYHVNDMTGDSSGVNAITNANLNNTGAHFRGWVQNHV